MTTTTKTLCLCGKPADPELVELAAAFPKIIVNPLCIDCSKREDQRQAEIAKRDRERRELHERSLRCECVPPEIRRTRTNYPGFNAALWLRVEVWKPSEIRWLGLVGNAGCCKTRCLGLLVERLIMDGHRVTWTTALEFQDRVDDLRSDERGVPGEARAYLRQAKTTGILVIDDLGKNTWTPAVERHLFDVIDHRKTHDLPILWSANTHPIDILKSGQLSKDRAAALIGRLIEASRIEKV